MKKLLTKMPVYLSELTPDEIDSLGTDPIDIENALALVRSCTGNCFFYHLG